MANVAVGTLGRKQSYTQDEDTLSTQEMEEMSTLGDRSGGEV